MNYRALLNLCGIAIFSSAIHAHAGECDDPKTSAAIAQCLGQDLRDSDAKINSTYKQLMGSLNDADKIKLRNEQRAWIKERDSVCGLNTKESDRGKWYKALLQDYAKTICVTRYTRQRTKALDRLAAGPSSPEKGPAVQPKPTPANELDIAYDKKKATTHSAGKWYFEITVNYGEVVKIESTVFAVGVIGNKEVTGVLDNIRPRDASKEAARYGVAVDLDNGKLYVSRNGVWDNGDPGSNQGQDLKLGRSYYATFIVSADSSAPYLEHHAIVPNFGDTPMTYALPAGYRPWRSQVLN